MGNRACVVFTDGREFSPAIYLHWNGGPESVYAFLDALKDYDALGDVPRTAARFTQLVGNYFGGTLSLALIPLDDRRWQGADPGDNGVYLVTMRHGNYTVRRFSRCAERDPGAVEQERAEAYRHPYFTGSPLIRQQIDAVNEEPFRRLEKQLAQRRLAVG